MKHYITSLFLGALLSLNACSSNDNLEVEQPKSTVFEDKNLFGGKKIENFPINYSQSSSQNGKSSLFAAVGIANETYGKPGPYEVTTNDVLGNCDSYFAVVFPIIQALGIVDESIKCNNAFPYGLDSAVSLHVYYPKNIKNMNKLPVINFVGGFTSNTANYSELATLWASYGYVVMVSSNFVNVLPSMHLLAFNELKNFNNDPQSPLYGKVDLSKSLIGGHSAGGGASLLTGSISPSTFKLIDNNINVLGILSLEGSPLAIGATVKYPTLFLTGLLDVIVPPFVNQFWQSNQMFVPNWRATATTATHFSPVMQISNNEFAGITVAWNKYLAENDPNAKKYFVGSPYKLKQDNQFVQSILSPVRVSRNSYADALQ